MRHPFDGIIDENENNDLDRRKMLGQAALYMAGPFGLGFLNQAQAQVTTLALGEEAGNKKKPGATTKRKGEEGGITTHALGEEGARPPRPVQPGVERLFDGKTLRGWVDKSGKPVTAGWGVENGVLRRKSKGGDIYTAKEYGDFELSFEWKIAAGSNSGVKYRVRKYDGKKTLGIEYQLLDDAKHKYPKGHKGSTAAIYDIIGPDIIFKKLNKPGEWNTAKIVSRGTIIQHWLNDKVVAQADMRTAEWRKALAASKFKNVKGFAENRHGKIMLQDHGGDVSFRKITIKSFGAVTTTARVGEEGGKPKPPGRVTTLALGEES